MAVFEGLRNFRSKEPTELIPVVPDERVAAEKEDHRKYLFGEPPYNKHRGWSSDYPFRSLIGDIRYILGKIGDISRRLDKLEGKDQTPPARVPPEQIRFYIREWLDEHQEEAS